jgi:hypothetical protein
MGWAAGMGLAAGMGWAAGMGLAARTDWVRKDWAARTGLVADLAGAAVGTGGASEAHAGVLAHMLERVECAGRGFGSAPEQSRTPGIWKNKHHVR